MLKNLLTKTSLSILLCTVLLNFKIKAQSPYANHNHWVVLNSAVNAITQDANYVYIGGDFNYVGPPTGRGAKMTTTNTNPDLNYCRPHGIIHTSISDGAGGWYIGGDFTSITTSFSTTVTRNRIAHIFSNGQLDMTWDPNANNTVYALAFSGSDLFVGGQFTNIGGQVRNRIAKLSATGSGTADAMWDANANTNVVSLLVSGSDLYAGGYFNSIGGQSRNGIAKLTTTGTGTADATWNPNSNDVVNSMAISGSDLFTGGAFTSIGGQTRNRIAKLTTVGTGTADATWDPNANSSISSLALSGNEIYVGGNFSTIGGQTRNRIAKLTTIGTGTADATWDPNAVGGWVSSLVYSSGNVYVGGIFTSIGGQSLNCIAKLTATGTGTADVTWDPNANTSEVKTLAISGNDLYVGGYFHSIGGFTRNNIARFSKINGAADPTWNPNANNFVHSLLLTGSDLYVGGDFTNIGGQTRNGIAKLSTAGTGTADATWNPNASGSVYSFVLSGSDLYVGGFFSSIGGQSRNNIARLTTTGTGTADATWNPNASNGIRSLALSGTDLYVGGFYSSIGGQSRNRIAKITTAGTGTADATWDPNASGVVLSIVPSGSDLYVGGYFTNIGGQARNYIAKLTSTGTGTADLTWNPNAGNQVNALQLVGSDLYAGGVFTSIGGQTRNRIARLTTTGTGTADVTWNPNAAGGSVLAFAFSGTDLYFGGSFSDIGGIYPRWHFALLGNYCGPTTPSLSVSNVTICPGQPNSLSISSGSLFTATNWSWYNASCGTGSVGTGTMITVNPTTTTTYYARGEGGCVGTSASCATIAVTVLPCTGIESNSNFNSSTFNVYPNPTNGILNFELGIANENTRIEMRNALGQIVLTKKINSQNTSINVSDLSSGIYFLQVFSENKITGTQKIIKQ